VEHLFTQFRHIAQQEMNVMGRFKVIVVSVLMFVSISCNSGVPSSMPTATADLATITPTALPTSTATSTLPPLQSSGFPYAPELNDALPKEGLVLGEHVYSDKVCYDVGIYEDDTYIIISCLGEYNYPTPDGKLNEAESTYLRRWRERYAGFDEPSAHGLLQFNGSGKTVPDPIEKLSMGNLTSAIEFRAHAYVSGGGLPSGVLAAQRALAQEMGVPYASVTINKFEPVDFPDSCLGVPKVDEVCEQFVTPGLRVLLVTDGMLYEYHTDFAGFDVRPFGEPQIAPTPGAGG
jgi:hypothetical protein